MSYHPDQPNISRCYVSYLLRLWHTQSGGDEVWRASLEDPLTQEVFRFDDLQCLLVFLLEQTGQSAGISVPNDAQ
jgi:hypothetical protein